MLRSTQNQATKSLVRKVINLLQEVPLLISWASLNIIEEQWTCRSCMPPSYRLNEMKFYASVTDASFLLPEWGQVWELVVIAVAQDAFESLVTDAKYSPRTVCMPPQVEQNCDTEAFKNVIAKLYAGKARHTLLAALNRICLRISGEGSSVHPVPSNGVSRDIVHYLYGYSKKGQNEPQEPFTHTSTSDGQTHLTTSSKEPFDFGSLNVSGDGCVLAYADGHRHDPGGAQMSSVCVFFTDGPADLPTTETLGTAIKTTYENYDVYHTSRTHRAPNYLENSYGIFSIGFFNSSWLAFLGSPPLFAKARYEMG